jgi:hypothetical protein
VCSRLETGRVIPTFAPRRKGDEAQNVRVI